MMHVAHHCKNTKNKTKIKQGKREFWQEACNNAWVDKDLTTANKPPTWKYCDECVEKGYANPKSPPKSNHGLKASENLKRWREEQLTLRK